MRREVLWASVLRVLGDVEVLDVAYMWRRHRWSIPAGAVAGAVCGVLATLVGWSAASAVAIGLAALAVAVGAGTEYRVLAVTDRGLVLMKGGRVRQVARPPADWLPDGIRVERVANNLVVSDWMVGGDRFSVMRRHESTMSAIAASRST